MYERNSVDLHRPPEVNDIHARLKWLMLVNEHEERRRNLFRDAAEEEEMMLMQMRSTFNVRESFSLFGMLLGLFPPAAIFARMFGYGMVGPQSGAILFIGCVLMNLVCAIVGYYMGGVLGRAIVEMEKGSWTMMMLALPVIGAAWGAVTGAAGGLVFLGIGAMVGPIFAIPIGAMAFTCFAPLHRLLARGGMIEERHYWPLASAAALLPAALVMGM